MLANPSMTSGIEIYVIDAIQENLTTDFESSIIDGDNFESVTRNPVMIGKALADKMKISTGNRLVMTFQGLNGDITSTVFRVILCILLNLQNFFSMLPHNRLYLAEVRRQIRLYTDLLRILLQRLFLPIWMFYRLSAGS